MSGAATLSDPISFLPVTLPAAELERRKLARLQDLHATIDALRHEQAHADPLLAWIIEREIAETRRRD